MAVDPSQMTDDEENYEIIVPKLKYVEYEKNKVDKNTCFKLKLKPNPKPKARNAMQIFYAKTLSIVFAQRTVFNVFHQHILNSCSTPETANERVVLMRLLSLYGGNILVGRSGLLCEGGFVTSPASVSLYKQGVLNILSKLKDDAIALVDAIAPTDFIIDSPLGMSDGEVYRHLQSKLFQSPGVFERPAWWKDMVHWQSDVKAKL